MLELIIKKEESTKKIALVENGKLIEYYEDDNTIKRNEENLYIGVVKDILKGMQAAFVDIGTEKNSFIHLKDLLPKVDEKKENLNINVDINQIVKVNDKILVQVKKDSDYQKGARVSKHISLTSKYIVLMPNTSIITISKKIVDESEKDRLIKIVKKNLPENFGIIIRTSAEGVNEKDLIEDINQELDIWNQIQKRVKENKKAPCLIYQSPDIVYKIIIDTFLKGFEKIVVDDQKEYNAILEFLNENEKYKNIKVVLNNNDDIFDNYELKKQIDKIQDRKVWLKCGGFITIDKTEALTAIDVNTGKYTGNKSLEDTVYKVNQEATYEIARQVKLRDIGGIIIVDYIDMDNIKNKEKITNLLKERLKDDRAKTQVEGFTKLDLMEFTRKHICSHIKKNEGK